MISPLIIMAGVLVVLISAASFALGYRRGKDAGWVDHYMQSEREKASRRGKDGKFIALRCKEARTS